MADATMKGLSIRQPWPFAILHLGKPVENRSWAPPQSMIGERFLIHASKWGSADDLYDCFKLDVLPMARAAGIDPKRDLPPVSTRDLMEARGGIVGSAILDRIILPGGWTAPDASGAQHRDPLADSPWYTGEYGLVLADVQELPFTPLRGALGFFDVPDDVVERLGVAA